MNVRGSEPFVVAIDGPAGAGKSTVARKLSARLRYAFLDTGAIYRSVALSARRRGIDWADAEALSRLAEGLEIRFIPSGDVNVVMVEGQEVTHEIRTPEMSDGASRVSALAPVRAALLGLQRRLAQTGNIVAEGRDMGTVVFPGARAKFFLTASPQERARRRTQELLAAGRPAEPNEVLRELLERDQRDTNRAAAPLRRADDAIEIDSGGLTPDEVVDMMAKVVHARGG